MGLALGLLSCGPGPTVIAKPMDDATNAVATAPTSKPKPEGSVAIAAVSAPKPLEVASAPIVDAPPAPHIPPRTCPTLPDVPAASLGSRSGKTIVVSVSDYFSLAPVSAVVVHIVHHENCTRGLPGGCRPSHPHPASQLRMNTKTDKQGRAIFRVPDLDYDVQLPHDQVMPGYLTFSSIYDLGTQKCHPLAIEKRSPDERTLTYEAYVIPEGMRAIRTEDQAFAAAMQNQELRQWLPEHPEAERMHVRDKIAVWDVGFGNAGQTRRVVHVNAFDGTSFVIGRWN